MNTTEITENPTQRSSSVSSRRKFFEITAKLFGASAAVSAALVAQTTGGGTGTGTGTPAVTDLAVLQYALGLENLEAAFYNKYVPIYGGGDITRTQFGVPFGTGITGNLNTYLQQIQAHENAHVAAISAAITGLGGTPNPACVYTFPVNSFDDFIRLAMTLENTGVTAYDGAIGLITNPALIQAGATIATVEARHASYLNLLNGNIPFPSAFDMAATMAQVMAMTAPFIVSCPANPGGGTGGGATGGGGTPPTALLRANAAAPGGTTNPVQTTTGLYRLDASGSTVGTGATIVSYSYKVVQGSASIYQGNTAFPTIQLGPGTGTQATIQVTVTDSNGNTSVGSIATTGPNGTLVYGPDTITIQRV